MTEEIKRFEDLETWQVARQLTREIYAFTRVGDVARDFGFIDQIRRAVLSIMNNIAEGFERGSNKDFCKFLFVARASAGEVRSMLYVALDQQYLAEAEFNEYRDLCVRCGQLCWGLIRHLQKNSDWKTGMAIKMLVLANVLGSLFSKP